MNATTRTLIVGGYGHVGRGIAARLLRARATSVRLAGRDPVKAQEAAATLGCEAAHMDLANRQTWDGALDRVDVVVVCVDQQDADFPAHVLAKGLAYIDITASDRFLRSVEMFDDLAQENGGRAILSVGLAPGLTNLLVKACAERVEHPVTARIGIMLGLGDVHGPAAIAWTLNQFRSLRGTRVEVEPVPFGVPPRTYPAISFDFADQHVVRRTLGLKEARTLLAFDSRILSRIMFPLLKRIASSQQLTALAMKAMPRLRLGTKRAALAITVEGRGESRCAYLEGREEAQITALMAALTVQHVLHSDVSPGVKHIEQVLSIETLVPTLNEHGVRVHLP